MVTVAAIEANADMVVADSIEQCLARGEIYKAIPAGDLKKEGLIELGNIIGGKDKGRISDQQTTVTDLTGVAVQDINIASLYSGHLPLKNQTG